MSKILKHTWSILTRREKSKFRLLILLDIIISLADIAALALLLLIIQFYAEPGKASLLSIFPPSIANPNSPWVIGIFFLIFAIKNIAAFLVSGAHNRFISRVAIRLSDQQLQLYQNGTYEGFVETDTSVHIRKIAFQPFEFCQYLLTGIQQLVTQVSLITLAIIAILFFDARLFLLLLLLLLPPVLGVFWFVRKKMSVTREKIRLGNEDSFRYLLDALKGWVEGNIYQRNEFLQKRFSHARKKFSRHLFNSIHLQAFPGRIIEIFAVMGLFILIMIALRSENPDHSTLLTIGAFMAAAYKIIPGSVKIINTMGQLKGYEKQLKELGDNGDEYLQNNRIASEGITSIKVSGIRFRYPKQQILQYPGISIESGDIIGLTGKSGKGKTTFLHILFGFLDAEGEISINGNVTDQLKRKYYWPFISYVRQQTFLINDTLMRNIILDEGEPDSEKLAFALEASGLNDLVATYPEGLGKMITENGKNISGGQQQRVAIARALYKDADALVLDEPFNELDKASIKKIMTYIKELASKGRIIILVTHDQQVLNDCTKIYWLDEATTNIAPAYAGVSEG